MTTTTARRLAREEARPKDAYASAIVLGFMSTAWFAWSMAGPTNEVVALVGIGVGIVVGVAAIVLQARASGVSSMAVDPAARKSWWTWLLAELLAIGAGLVVLNLVGHPQYFAAWTFAVVALHFLPLARSFSLPSLNAVTGLGVLGAVAAVVAGVTGVGDPVVVAGLAGGTVLLAGGIALLVRRR